MNVTESGSVEYWFIRTQNAEFSPTSLVDIFKTSKNLSNIILFFSEDLITLADNVFFKTWDLFSFVPVVTLVQVVVGSGISLSGI